MLTRRPDVIQKRSWRIIAWFNRPFGKIVQLFVTIVGVAALDQLNDQRFLFWLLVFAIFFFNALVFYGTSEWQRIGVRLHIENIQDALRFELQTLYVMLRANSGEDLQLAVMLHYGADVWIPEIRYNMQEGRGKHRVTFVRGTMWMAYADVGRTVTLNITDEVRQLLDEDDRQCFSDVSKVLVTPIFQPEKPQVPEHVIGALAVYSPAEENSVLERQSRRIFAIRACSQLGRMISPDYWTG